MLRGSQKAFQILLKFTLYVLGATDAFEPHDSFSIDHIMAGETEYLVTLADDSFLIQKNGQIYIQVLHVFFCGLYF